MITYLSYLINREDIEKAITIAEKDQMTKMQKYIDRLNMKDLAMCKEDGQEELQ